MTTMTATLQAHHLRQMRKHVQVAATRLEQMDRFQASPASAAEAVANLQAAIEKASLEGVEANFLANYQSDLDKWEEKALAEPFPQQPRQEMITVTVSNLSGESVTISTKGSELEKKPLAERVPQPRQGMINVTVSKLSGESITISTRGSENWYSLRDKVARHFKAEAHCITLIFGTQCFKWNSMKNIQTLHSCGVNTPDVCMTLMISRAAPMEEAEYKVRKGSSSQYAHSWEVAQDLRSWGHH
jgi:hypothetical protein